jgi:ankyrin repeat protein
MTTERIPLMSLDLCLAMINDNNEYVMTYIKEGNPINCVDKYGRTLLIFAIKNESSLIINELLNHKDIDKIINVFDKEGYTAFMHLCFGTANNMYKELLQCTYLNVNAISQNSWGVTALMITIYSNKLEITKELLSRPEIDIYKFKRYEINALMIAQNIGGRQEAVKILKCCIINDLKFLWSPLSKDIIRHIVENY